MANAVGAPRAARCGPGASLEQCFEKFTTPERLDEDNLWYCGKCKEHRRAVKELALWRLPAVLVISLKRFSGASHSGSRGSLQICGEPADSGPGGGRVIVMLIVRL